MAKKLQVLGVIVLLSTGSCHASKLIPTQSKIYYKLGSSSVFVPAVKSLKKVNIGARIESNLLPNCSGFNPMVSIKNSFKNLKNSFNGIEKDLVTSTTNALLGFPLAKLQQSMPGLFDMMKSQNLFAGNEFKLKVAKCEAIKKQVAQGQSPFDGLVSLTDSQGWVEGAKRAVSADKSGNSSDEVDINVIEKNITKNKEKYGLPWLHDRDSSNNYAGGSEQKEIKVIGDVVIAGYNLLASPGSKLDSKEPPPKNTTASFVRFWPNPVIASDWATKVLGEITFTKKKNAASNNNQAGIGLAAVLQSCPRITENGNTCVKNVSEYVWKLVNGEETLTPENLNKLSGSNMVVTADIITTIQALSREKQIIVIAKLSEDLAIQNLLEEALSLRKILQAGLNVQEVQNLKPIRDIVKDTIERLNKEIESLAFENNVRRQMANRTLNTILSIRDEALNESEPDVAHSDAMIKNGAIYKKGASQGGDV